MTFGEKIIRFNNSLDFTGTLPSGIRIMNPFRESAEANTIAANFYHRFYNDNKQRKIILGINPGRFGAGITGIPFTDTKRLKEYHHTELTNVKTHEPSAVFVYEVIMAYGGLEKFYGDFYISSVCPLGFTKMGPKGELNYNYYDSKQLIDAVCELIVNSLQMQLQFGLNRDIAFCLGTGKNVAFLEKLNNKYHFFKRIQPLEHPRFVMQYKSKTKHEYVEKYVKLLGMNE